MAKNLTKELKAKKKTLEAAFEKEKQAIVSIDNLFKDMQQRRGAHVQEMNRLQGEYRLVQELLGEDPEIPPAPKKRSK